MRYHRFPVSDHASASGTAKECKVDRCFHWGVNGGYLSCLHPGNFSILNSKMEVDGR